MNSARPLLTTSVASKVSRRESSVATRTVSSRESGEKAKLPGTAVPGRGKRAIASSVSQAGGSGGGTGYYRREMSRLDPLPHQPLPLTRAERTAFAETSLHADVLDFIRQV